jgi:hypothetical protein
LSRRSSTATWKEQVNINIVIVSDCFDNHYYIAGIDCCIRALLPGAQREEEI